MIILPEPVPGVLVRHALDNLRAYKTLRAIAEKVKNAGFKKLTEEDRREIRKSTKSASLLAGLYGVSKATIVRARGGVK